MPTANTTSAKASKPRAKAAKATSAKGPAAKAPRAKASSVKSAPKASARTTHKVATPIQQAQNATRETAGAVGDYAERAVLIPVGAALIARERVVATVSDTISTYSSTTKTQAQLRKFERRGTTARNRLEREVRKARVRVERDLRQRRRAIETTVSELEERRDAIVAVVPDISELATRVPELAGRVQERILTLV